MTSEFRIFVGLIVLIVCQIADARPPEIRSLNLRGLQIGAATVVTIDGVDLLPAPKVFLDEQPIEATADPTSNAARLVLSIPLSNTVIPGIANLRIATIEGFSNSVPVGLDRLSQLPLADEVATTQVAVHGSVPGSGVSRTTFSAKAAEDLIIEVEARRLGSKLRPVIHLYDSHRVQLGWARPTNTLAGDARLIVKLPRDDKYTVEVHDAQYAPPGPSYFRLKIGNWQFADLAFPPTVLRGQETTVELLGNVVGLKSSLRADGTDLLAAVVPSPNSFSGLPPTVFVSQFSELIKSEQPMNLPGLPIGVSGRLNAKGQMDRFLLPVTPGMKITAEVFAERIGSRVDAAIELRNKAGGVLVANDDAPNTTDPKLELTIPADLDSVEIIVRDQLDLGRDDSIYRLVVSNAAQLQPGFEIVLKADVVNAAGGETPVLEALVTRQGYDGPIQLRAEAAPPGIVVSGTEIPAGANGTLLGFTNSGQVAEPLVTRFIAQSPDGSITRRVRIETATDDKTPAWMHERIALAATAKPETPFQITITNEAAMTQFVLASKLAVPIKVNRPPSMFGPVRLSLMTSQPLPKVNGQPNPSLSIRAEKLVEIAVDNAVLTTGNAFTALDKLHAAAVQQALVAQADAKVAADAKVTELIAQRVAAEAALRDAESKAVYQSDYIVVVPSVLGQSSCDLSLRAELLNPERNQVLRTTYLPIKRLLVRNPLVVKLDGPPMVETTLDPVAGASIKLTAKIERFAGYVGDASVVVQGMPAGVTAANAVVKADSVDFMTEIKLPGNFAGPENFTLKLTATGPADPLSGNIPVKSEDVEVMIKVNRPAK